MISVHLLTSAIQPALTLALLGSIDSLLTSLIADAITRTRHNPDRELIGQGIGNTIAGLIWGLPGAGATLGTVVNIRAGGRTQVSGVLRAAILLTLVLGLGKYVEVIPHAVLAGILMKVGWDIIDWRFITRIHRVQREHLLVMVITMGLTVFVDLVTAVVVGLIAAGMAYSRQLERLELDNVVSVPLSDQSFLMIVEDSDDVDEFSARVGLVALRGSFSVASSVKLINAISLDIQEHEIVILDFSGTVSIDDSAALVVEQMIDIAIAEDTECIVMGLTGAPETALLSLNVLKRVPKDQFVADLDEAREVSTAHTQRLGVCLKIPRSVLGGGCDVQYWWWSGLGSESRSGPVGSFTPAPAPRKGPAGQDFAFQAGFDEPAATGFALHSFSRLWVKDTRVNSPATLWMPRSRNCLKPRTCLVSPWTGSVMTLRRAYTSRP